MRTGFILCLLSFVISGCSTTVQLESADDANSRIDVETAKIVLKSGVEYTGERLYVGRDSTRFIDVRTTGVLEFANRDIQYIRVSNQTVGAAEGLLIGAVGMGLLGFVIAPHNVHPSDEDKDNQLGIPIRPFTIMLCAIGGGVAGAVFGVIRGHQYTYLLPKNTAKIGLETPVDSTISSDRQILKSTP
jgi:hypothetical protein